MPVYPNDTPVCLEKYRDYSTDGYNTWSLSCGLHTGTHIDAPLHMFNSDKTMADYSLEHFIGNGVLINALGESQIGFKAEYEKCISKDDIVLIYTGFDEFYGQTEYYEKHPIITEDFARFLVSKRIKMLGMDMPSPDFSPFNVHKLLLSNRIFIIESMTCLDKLIGINSFKVLAIPLKIHAEASPVRAFALLNDW